MLFAALTPSLRMHRKVAYEWQNSVVTSNTLITKLFNKTTKSTLPAASLSLVLNSAATSSSPGMEQNKQFHFSTHLLFHVANIDVTNLVLMPPNCSFAQCKCHQDMDPCEEAVVLRFAGPFNNV